MKVINKDVPDMVNETKKEAKAGSEPHKAGMQYVTMVVPIREAAGKRLKAYNARRKKNKKLAPRNLKYFIALEVRMRRKAQKHNAAK